jgi:general stress protein 26
MSSDKNLQFINSKIEEIQVARFHCTSTSLLKIPSRIVNTFKVNDDGHLLFFLPRPTQLISQFDKDFPVELNYFRKGASGYLDVYGKARIVNDPEELFEYELSAEESMRALNTDILVVVKILKADYHVSEASSNASSFVSKVKSFVYGVLTWVEPNSRSYDFSKPQIPNYGF